jgi:hypothetical protein
MNMTHRALQPVVRRVRTNGKTFDKLRIAMEITTSFSELSGTSLSMEMGKEQRGQREFA